MNGYQNILDKLNGFTKKYYTKQLIKGCLLFLALGILFWILVMSLEYFLWLNEQGRLFLFSVFILVELFLLIKFIIIPVAYLSGLKKGMTNKGASRLIAKHFPEVSDRLYNLLELSENPDKSELLLASIEQRSNALRPVPFKEAINFTEGFGYARYLGIPAAILILVWISGDFVSFISSHKRIVNYDLAFEQPAPFKFVLLNDELNVLDNEPLELRVAIEGDVRPDEVFLVVDGENILMRPDMDLYTYSFESPVDNMSFYLSANGWNSRNYSVVSLSTPRLHDFRMELIFPKYLGKAREIITGSGNHIVPEGTQVSWNIKGQNVHEIAMASRDTVNIFKRNADVFQLNKTVYSDLDYEISTSNDNVSGFESLGYLLEVVKDEYPTIEVNQVKDSANPNLAFVSGLVSDDYAVREIRAVAYPHDNPSDMQRISLVSLNKSVHKFYYTFPSGFQLDKGLEYAYYFEVIDNDGLRNGKLTKSKVFRFNVFDDKKLIDKELELQNNILQDFDRNLEKYVEQKDELSKIKKSQRENMAADFEDKNRIKDFLRRQQEQEELMEKFSRQLKESVNKSNEENERQRMLKERLERHELQAQKNKALLDELNKLAEQIDKEELKQKLEELGKKQSASARNLEQILELTKRYYVTEKMKQLASRLEDLAKEQIRLAEMERKNDVDGLGQKKANENFDELANQIKQLREDNKGLEKPIQMGVKKEDVQSVKEDQKEALDEILEEMDAGQQGQNQKENSEAGKSSQRQRSAAQKMKEMGESMQQSSSGGGGSEITEDAEMLRQILDNLVTFSFKQEQLFEEIEGADVDVSQFSGTVRSQKELRGLFEHVDDSLFALSLRRAELSEFVNEQITEVYYNIDKSLESIAENQIFQGAAYQQYVVNATNTLADFLANTLDNMQQNMKPGNGSGNGSSGFQLPDIIQGQQDIQEKMEGSGSGQTKGSEGKGDEEGKGKGEKESEGLNGEADKGKQGGDGTGNQKGGEGSGSNGESEGDGREEMEMSKIYEIYKEQQVLRKELEQQLLDMINNSDRDLARKLVRQMEEFEEELLENGITQRTRDKANAIQHQLLKLKNASMRQGKEKERESRTTEYDFRNPILAKPELLNKGFNDVEILNRQALPLRQNYEKKVKVYFKND